LDHILETVPTQSQANEIRRVIISSNNKHKLIHIHVMKAYFDKYNIFASTLKRDLAPHNRWKQYNIWKSENLFYPQIMFTKKNG